MLLKEVLKNRCTKKFIIVALSNLIRKKRTTYTNQYMDMAQNHLTYYKIMKNGLIKIPIMNLRFQHVATVDIVWRLTTV